MDYHFLAQTSLFEGLSKEEIEKLLQNIKHNIRRYKRGQYIYTHGQTVQNICVVLSGSVQIENIDVLGNKNILALCYPGEIIGEMYACIPNQAMLIDAVTKENTEVLFINVPSLFSEINSNAFGNKIILNMLRTSARKNLILSTRIFHTSPKTIRARLYSYFSQQISVQGSNDITIPLDRQQLADYLSVDRTALSKELGKMRDEGLLTFHKNNFRLNV